MLLFFNLLISEISCCMGNLLMLTTMQMWEWLLQFLGCGHLSYGIDVMFTFFLLLPVSCGTECGAMETG